jgi:hypothetical protein
MYCYQHCLAGFKSDMTSEVEGSDAALYQL